MGKGVHKNRVRTGMVSVALLMLGSVAVADPAPEESGEKKGSAEAAEKKAPTIQEGQAFLRSGDAPKAIEVFEALTTADPNSARAWSGLGQARAAAGKDEEAVPALLRAASLAGSERLRDSLLFAAARAQARLGRTEEALLLLGTLRREGTFDLTNADADASFESLLGDSRFQALQPSSEELAEPFAEDVRVLAHWPGEAPGDNFGWIARRLGDVDGDGVQDFVTSAPGKNLDGASAGRIYVYSTKSGKLLWSRDGEPGDRLGRGVESAGDVDGDGVSDVVASAPGGDKVFVFNGKNGATLLTLAAAQPGESVGQHVKGVGDVNGDGRSDILLGAPGYDVPAKDVPPAGDDGLQDAGRAALYSGADGALLWQRLGDRAGARLGETVAGGHDGKRTVLLVGAPGVGEAYAHHGTSAEAAHTFHAELTGSSFGGMFMSVVGDVDGDGTGDLYISDWSDGAARSSVGKVYVFSGADGRRLLTLVGEASGDGFGIGSAEAGDVNDDGHDDLVIGAWRHSSKASGAGKIYVISGKDGSELRTVTADVPGETFGFDAQGIGDVDGDGAVDLLLTSAWSRIAGARSGRIFVLAGER